MFRDDGFCSHLQCFRKKIADKNEFSLEALKLQEKSHFTYQHWNITNVNRIIISVNIV